MVDNVKNINKSNYYAQFKFMLKNRSKRYTLSDFMFIFCSKNIVKLYENRG